MASPSVVVRVAGQADAAALAALRALWSEPADDPAFERRMADWLAAEGERRTTWLAEVGGAPAGDRLLVRPGRR